MCISDQYTCDCNYFLGPLDICILIYERKTLGRIRRQRKRNEWSSTADVAPVAWHRFQSAVACAAAIAALDPVGKPVRVGTRPTMPGTAYSAINKGFINNTYIPTFYHIIYLRIASFICLNEPSIFLKISLQPLLFKSSTLNMQQLNMYVALRIFPNLSSNKNDLNKNVFERNNLI